MPLLPVPEAGWCAPLPRVRLRTGASVDIEEKAGNLVQLNGKRRAAKHTPQQFYSMSLWIQRERGYKPGYAAAKFKGRFGHWPRVWLRLRPNPTSLPATFSRPTRSASTRRKQKDAAMLHEPLKDRAARPLARNPCRIGCALDRRSQQHRPCPMLWWRDRFRFDDKGGRGTWICSNCGAGDGIELVKRFHGVDSRKPPG